jgi:phosphoribosyl-ATP pyrophosphohydrolase/phosphoribosyl-AMP cyclohydrolase/histidinol dehydrogenase
MTVATARAAGCGRVVLATPRPGELMLAAAGLCGADAVLPVGGAHGVGALAYGAGVLGGVDVIAGPGNAWVTAAKRCVCGDVGIDMLAGPSELLVLADESAEARVVAADLLAQAEHDELARPMLVTTDAGLVEAVEAELARRLETLPTAATARVALANGFAAVAVDMDEAMEAVDRVAPEHLEIHARDAGSLARRVRHAGAVFVGAGSAEVLGDYGLGPNHTLPTGGAARATGGLSVLAFLRVRTWLRVDEVEASSLADVVRLAEIEGLEGHRRSAMARS